jgi:hypothetical protein
MFLVAHSRFHRISAGPSFARQSRHHQGRAREGHIVQVNLINPHSFIYLEEKTTRDRSVGGPSKARQRFNSNEWALPWML